MKLSRLGIDQSLDSNAAYGDEFGVYIHIPFCRKRCEYCAFATFTDREYLIPRYVASCIDEIQNVFATGEGHLASSIFFGGGTPSLLDATSIANILEAIPAKPDAEVTLECNPEDINETKLEKYRSSGITRMSFGIQSIYPHVLDGLGRARSPMHIEELSALVSKVGFSTWNLDLIFGGYGESNKDWIQTLKTVVGLDSPPPHISAYALTVEPGTPLAHRPDRHPDDEVQADRYELTDQILEAHGYSWEEISNWAQPGHECRHNQLYWHQGNYLGFGSGAHSHRDGRRWWNLRTPERYIEAVGTQSSPIAGVETLRDEEKEFERLLLLLRTPNGVEEDALEEIEELDSLVFRRGGRKILTLRGRLLANYVSNFLVCDRSVSGRKGLESNFNLSSVIPGSFQPVSSIL